jgi:hypothetical membrane protein
MINEILILIIGLLIIITFYSLIKRIDKLESNFKHHSNAISDLYIQKNTKEKKINTGERRKRKK